VRGAPVSYHPPRGVWPGFFLPPTPLRTMDRIFLAVIVSGLLLLTGAFGLVPRGHGSDLSAERSLLMPSVVPRPSESGTVGQSARPAGPLMIRPRTRATPAAGRVPPCCVILTLGAPVEAAHDQVRQLTGGRLT
jgi:hypothetical protein